MGSELVAVDGIVFEVDSVGGGFVGGNEEMVVRAIRLGVQPVLFIGGMEKFKDVKAALSRIEDVIDHMNHIEKIFGKGNVIIGSEKRRWAIPYEDFTSGFELPASEQPNDHTNLQTKYPLSDCIFKIISKIIPSPK